MKSSSFRDHADLAMRDGNVQGLRPVIEKEILHYEILHALAESGLLSSLVFQGGTALRLCHGGVRYSEDLDFSGGTDFDGSVADEIVSVVRRHIERRYGLHVSIVSPDDRKLGGPVRVYTWSIRIEIDPGRRGMPLQRIKIDIDTTRSWTVETGRPFVNYDFLPPDYAAMLIPVQSRQEIMANKLVALPSSIMSRNRPRYRDIWDIDWLAQRRVPVDPVMMAGKAAEHGVESLATVIEYSIERIETIVFSPEFKAEMMRFLPLDVRARTIDSHDWTVALARSTSDILDQALRGIRVESAPSSP